MGLRERTALEHLRKGFKFERSCNVRLHFRLKMVEVKDGCAGLKICLFREMRRHGRLVRVGRISDEKQ